MNDFRKLLQEQIEERGVGSIIFDILYLLHTNRITVQGVDASSAERLALNIEAVVGEKR